MNRIALRTTITVVLAASLMARTGCGAEAGPSGTSGPPSPSGDAAPSSPSATPTLTESTEPAPDPGDVTTVTFEALADSVMPEDGPRTAQGIGLGSTRDEVTTAYPETAAQEPTVGDGEFLRVGAQGEPAIYFELREGATTVTSVTVTDRDELPYEVCA